MTAARNLAGFAANTASSGTLTGNVTGNLTGNVTFSDATTQTTASKWVLISSGYDSTGATEQWLTNNDITYGQYEQIRIIGNFQYASPGGSNYAPYLSIYKDGSGGVFQSEYHTTQVSGTSSSSNSYGSNSIYANIFAFSSAAYFSSYRPSLTFTWDIYCPPVAAWSPPTIWFEVRGASITNNGTMGQSSCLGHVADNTSVTSSSQLRPKIFSNGTNIKGSWQVYGLKK